MITFLPLGGANDIGASCYYININETGIILDCGSHPRKKGIDALPRFELIKDYTIDAALITHAHQDHIDGLPYLVQHHPYIKIVTTPQTRAIAELTLHNSVKILQDQLQNETEIRPYTHEEIDLLIQSIEWKSYTDEFFINGYRQIGEQSIIASFHDAGHILGSSGILLQHGDTSIFYTGDINLDRQMLLPGAALPDEKIDVLILEATHGATDSTLLPSWDAEQHRFAIQANKILGQGGSILIPVFALGKMQEMLVMLWTMMEKGSLARHDIYTGGIGRRISTVHDRNRFVVPYNDSEMLLADIPQIDLFEMEQLDDILRRPSIVLASSGMVVENTMSYKLAQRWLNHQKSAIFTVGYMDPDTPGFRIRSAVKGDMIQLTNSSEPQNVRCEIDQFRFSAHSRREGLMKIVKELQPSTVILVHGERPSIDWLGHSILENFPGTKVHAAEVGKPIILEN